jgi:hypothetical protein
VCIKRQIAEELQLLIGKLPAHRMDILVNRHASTIVHHQSPFRLAQPNLGGRHLELWDYVEEQRRGAGHRHNGSINGHVGIFRGVMVV